jgi:hypothetical protein
MKIRMKTILSGPDGHCDAGKITDLPEDRAYDLIERGYAEQVEDAELTAPETAEGAGNRRRRK